MRTLTLSGHTDRRTLGKQGRIKAGALDSNDSVSHSYILNATFVFCGIGKCPDCYYCNCLVKDEKGGQGHTSESLLHQSAMWHRAVNTHCFYTSVFRLRVSLCLRWMAKLSNVSALGFAWRSVNPLPKPLECFVRLLEKFFKPDSGF
jgi:hypothetical protein